VRVASLLLILVVGQLFSPLRSQPVGYHAHIFNESVGIRNFGIRSILRDKNGFLWILYYDGAERFDGKRLWKFKIESPNFILCDKDNHIWVTSFRHVYQFQNDVDGFKALPVKGEEENSFGAIFELQDQQLYLNSKNGFFRFEPKSKQFNFLHLPFNNKKPIDVVHFDFYGNTIFFEVGDTVYSLNLFTKVMHNLPVRNVYKFLAMNDQTLLLSQWDYASWWYDFSKSSMKKIDVRKCFPHDVDTFLNTRSFIRISPGTFLVSSHKGLLEYNASTDSFKKLNLYYDGHPLALYPSAVVYEDKMENIWMSYEGGLLTFNIAEPVIGLLRNSSSSLESGWNNNVRDLREDENGNLWFVTINGFAYWDLTSGKVYPFYQSGLKNSIQLYPSIRGIAYDGKYLILGPTDFGVWLYDVRHKSFSRPAYSNEIIKQSLENDFINQIYTLQNGNHVISGRSALYLLDGRTYTVSKIYYEGERERHLFCYEDSRSRIWIRTAANFYCLDQGFHVLHKFPQHVGITSVTSLAEISDEQFLTGSKGLYLMNLKKKASSFEKVDPFFDEMNISFLFIDKRKRIWIGTDNGLILYDMKSKEKRLFDYSDNMQGSGFYNQGFYQAKNGMLYVPGTNGINYFRPESIEMKRESLSVSILNMVVDEDDTSYHRHRIANSFPYSHNSVRFDFVAPYFSNVAKVKYRYSLRNETWKEIGNNNSIYFTSLSPGIYQFKVAATTNGLDWFESKPVSFTINPPFWNTWWFAVLCVLCAVSILYGLYQYRIRQIMKVQTVKNRISAELHDDIGTKLTNINILSTLTKQSMDDSEKAYELLKRISSEVQTSSEALDDIVWNINTKNDSLEEMIPRMRRYATEVLSGKSVKFNIQIPAQAQNMKLPMDKRHDLYLLFKEMINNIHKHAHATQVLVEIEMRDSDFVIHINDDGRGFSVDVPSGRNGLINMKMRTQRWKGKLSIQSTLDKGTDIRVSIPLKKIHSNGV
jgi:ligand-binding sensor domain-containing protein/two-component sensor histidine kinase